MRIKEQETRLTLQEHDDDDDDDDDNDNEWLKLLVSVYCTVLGDLDRKLLKH